MYIMDILATQTKNKLESEEDQIMESLANIATGNYKEFTVPEYRAELRKRFGKELDN